MNPKFIPLTISIVVILGIIGIWLLVYQCRPEPFISTPKLVDIPNSPSIKIQGKGPTRNILERFLNTKVSFNVKKSGGNYTIDVSSYKDYNFSGKGLVVAASGNRYRYLTGLYSNLYVIRKLLESDIPVEVFYVGKSERFSPKVKKLLEDLGNVTVVNLLDRIDTNSKESELRGYQTKPLAALCSSFEEVILMDADALSFVNPSSFFNVEGYARQGMVLFRDYVDCMNFISKDFIEDIGIGTERYCEKTRGYEIDSSCVIMNKQKCWDALYTICIINVKSDAYYRYKKNVLGDKDTWLIGSMFAGIDPFISRPRPGLLITASGEQLLGHLQQTIFPERAGAVPLYYNNQMVDMATADVTDWTYREVKNPERTSNVRPGVPITVSMKRSFDYAKEAMKELGPVIPKNLKNKLNSVNGVSAGFIP